MSIETASSTTPTPLTKKPDGRSANRPPWQRGRSGQATASLLRRIQAAPPVTSEHRTRLLAAVAAMPLLVDEAAE